MARQRCEVCGDGGYRMPLRTETAAGYEARLCDGICATQWLAVNGNEEDRASAREILEGTEWEDVSCVQPV